MNIPNQIAKTEDFEFAALFEAKNYRRSIINEFLPYMKGRLLEIGAGIGQITEALLDLKSIDKIVAIEPDGNFQQRFRTMLPDTRLICGTLSDLPTDEQFDCAVMVNVLEHIDDDQEELNRLYKILKPHKGYLCILVPARTEIYSKLDAHFGHYRRYTRRDLETKIRKTGFEMCANYYFNFIGYFAWLISFRIMGKMTFKINQVRFFDKIIFPVTNWIETKIVRPPIGQSIIVIARAS
jgi:SAM-dependent methyltransferase